MTAKPPLQKVKILVIEDSLDQWTLFQKALQEVNPQIQPVLAMNGHDAANLLQDWANEARLPQLILLDLYLPKRQDGWQTLETIQRLLPAANPVP